MHIIEEYGVRTDPFRLNAFTTKMAFIEQVIPQLFADGLTPLDLLVEIGRETFAMFWAQVAIWGYLECYDRVARDLHGALPIYRILL